MMMPDGRRLHLQDGPIDLIVEVFGAAEPTNTAYRAAAARFHGLLDELCGELTLLRAPAHPDGCPFKGAVACRMHAAVAHFTARCYITPMAAVAGSVAEEILASMTAATEFARAYVNNGGDIALHLSEGDHFEIGLVDRPDRPNLFGTLTLCAGDGIAGIATSGWRGRSFSLGVADSVTVLAASGSLADAAATVVANEVDLPGHPAVGRSPAREIQPDSDLGDKLVTRAVKPLRATEVDEALARGTACAERLVKLGLIRAAVLRLQGETRVTGLFSDDRSKESALPRFSMSASAECAAELDVRYASAESRASI
jgi:ApbE superfamily uncharacterized protein (UPF0280 family)